MKNLIKYISLFIITLCISCVTASADALSDTQKGSEAYLASDYKEALKWFRLAADQGFDDAQYKLGFMYDNGQGVPEDDVEAVKWYRLAADQGHASSQHNLGVMYAIGRGVPEDILMAYMWFNLSAARGVENAKTSKEIIEKKMTRQQIAEGQRLSREWFNEHQ